jgi:hypothetical protein
VFRRQELVAPLMYSPYIGLDGAWVFVLKQHFRNRILVQVPNIEGLERQHGDWTGEPGRQWEIAHLPARRRSLPQPRTNSHHETTQVAP